MHARYSVMWCSVTNHIQPYHEFFPKHLDLAFKPDTFDHIHLRGRSPGSSPVYHRVRCHDLPSRCSERQASSAHVLREPVRRLDGLRQVSPAAPGDVVGMLGGVARSALKTSEPCWKTIERSVLTTCITGRRASEMHC